MILTSHCSERLNQIAILANIPENYLRTKIENLCCNKEESIAYMVALLKQPIRNDCQNGDTVWVVARGGRAVTLFVRRRTQRSWDFGTDYTICLIDKLV